MTIYESLTVHQLILMAGKVGTHDLELNEEWNSRFGMNFPYRLSINGEIENRLMDKTINDQNADKLILKQDNRLRGERVVKQ
jgi:hypothetical protein